MGPEAPGESSPPPPGSSWQPTLEHRPPVGPCQPGLWPGRVRKQNDRDIQVQTAGLAEKRLIDTEEEEGQSMGTVSSLGICPGLDSQPAVERHLPSLEVSRREGGQGQWVGLGVNRKAGKRARSGKRHPLHMCPKWRKALLALLA